MTFHQIAVLCLGLGLWILFCDPESGILWAVSTMTYYWLHIMSYLFILCHILLCRVNLLYDNRSNDWKLLFASLNFIYYTSFQVVWWKLLFKIVDKSYQILAHNTTLKYNTCVSMYFSIVFFSSFKFTKFLVLGLSTCRSIMMDHFEIWHFFSLVINNQGSA